jgi:hypothetical protein
MRISRGSRWNAVHKHLGDDGQRLLALIVVVYALHDGEDADVMKQRGRGNEEGRTMERGRFGLGVRVRVRVRVR